MKLCSCLPLLIAAYSILTYASATSARPVRIWSMEELWQQADLVAVGTVQSTADSQVIADKPPQEHTWVPVKSIFDIQAILKGKLEGKTLSLHHFRFYKKDFIGFNGPVFIRFDANKKNQYLMFLKHMGAKDFYPLTGYVDPRYSFYLLQPYSRSRD